MAKKNKSKRDSRKGGEPHSKDGQRKQSTPTPDQLKRIQFFKSIRAAKKGAKTPDKVRILHFDVSKASTGYMNFMGKRRRGRALEVAQDVVNGFLLVTRLLVPGQEYYTIIRLYNGRRERHNLDLGVWLIFRESDIYLFGFKIGTSDWHLHKKPADWPLPDFEVVSDEPIKFSTNYPSSFDIEVWDRLLIPNSSCGLQDVYYACSKFGKNGKLSVSDVAAFKPYFFKFALTFSEGLRFWDIRFLVCLILQGKGGSLEGLVVQIQGWTKICKAVFINGRLNLQGPRVEKKLRSHGLSANKILKGKGILVLKAQAPVDSDQVRSGGQHN